MFFCFLLKIAIVFLACNDWTADNGFNSHVENGQEFYFAIKPSENKIVLTNWLYMGWTVLQGNNKEKCENGFTLMNTDHGTEYNENVQAEFENGRASVYCYCKITIEVTPDFTLGPYTLTFSEDKRQWNFSLVSELDSREFLITLFEPSVKGDRFCLRLDLEKALKNNFTTDTSLTHLQTVRKDDTDVVLEDFSIIKKVEFVFKFTVNGGGSTVGANEEFCLPKEHNEKNIRLDIQIRFDPSSFFLVFNNNSKKFFVPNFASLKELDLIRVFEEGWVTNMNLLFPDAKKYLNSLKIVRRLEAKKETGEKESFPLFETLSNNLLSPLLLERTESFTLRLVNGKFVSNIVKDKVKFVAEKTQTLFGASFALTDEWTFKDNNEIVLFPTDRLFATLLVPVEVALPKQTFQKFLPGKNRFSVVLGLEKEEKEEKNINDLLDSVESSLNCFGGVAYTAVAAKTPSTWFGLFKGASKTESVVSFDFEVTLESEMLVLLNGKQLDDQFTNHEMLQMGVLMDFLTKSYFFDTLFLLKNYKVLEALTKKYCNGSTRLFAYRMDNIEEFKAKKKYFPNMLVADFGRTWPYFLVLILLQFYFISLPFIIYKIKERKTL